MKYAHLIIGLLAGTAIGGSVVAGTGVAPVGGALDQEAVKKIVRETIAQEPKLIMDSVQKYQESAQKEQNAGTTAALKDPAVQEALYNNPNTASIGPKDSKRTVVEFFDYNCPVCKMQFKILSNLVKKDPTVRVLLIEFPIFGPVSDMNSKLGLAVWRLYPAKYYDFHDKMMGTPGHGPGNNEPTLAAIKELGMDVEKVKTEAASKEVAEALEKNRELGGKLRVQGTPLVIVGDEIIPHAVELAELEGRLKAIGQEK